MTWPVQRAEFDIPRDIAYFNCAYMSPLAHRVAAAGKEGVARKQRPWMLGPRDFFEEAEVARTRFGELINADPEGIALVPAASYGVGVAARALPLEPGEAIVVLEDQFPSNVYAWRALAARRGGRIETVARPWAGSRGAGSRGSGSRGSGRRGEGTWTDAILASIRPGVRIVAAANCHWTDGALIDLGSVAARCREIGAALVLDLTQSAGAHPFDTAAVKPDFVVCPSYKWLLGPYSLGCLYVAPRWRDAQPLEHSWIARAGSENFASLVDYRDDFQPGARRFDVGERANFALLPMLNEALAMLMEWTVPAISRTLAARTRTIAARAARLGFSSLPEKRRAPHFLGLELPPDSDLGPSELAARLSANGVYVSVRGRTLRVTPHLYNDEEDVERLFGVLEGLRGERL